MKKKNFKTRMVKVLDHDFMISFRGSFKVILKEYEAIEITKEEFEILKTRKDPFAEYNTAKKNYEAFVIPNIYGEDEHLIYVLSSTCKNYRGFKRHCSNCEPDSLGFNNYCRMWSCYCVESLSSYIKIYKSDNEDRKFGITSYRHEYDDSVDDRRNYYMYQQLKEQETASEDEFIPVKWK